MDNINYNVLENGQVEKTTVELVEAVDFLGEVKMLEFSILDNNKQIKELQDKNVELQAQIDVKKPTTVTLQEKLPELKVEEVQADVQLPDVIKE